MRALLFTTLISCCNFAFSQDLNSDLLLNLPISGGIADIENNSNIVLSGTEIFNEDRFGTPGCAIKFTGNNNEYINIPLNQDNQWQFGEPITISLWFKVENVIAGDFEVLFSSGNANQNGLGLCLYDVNTPLAVASDWSQWDDDWNNTPALYTDTLNWHHLAITIDANYNTVLYRDNQFIYASSELANSVVPQSPMDYRIGEDYRGSLDDIRVYKRVLTPQEIEQLFLADPTCDVISSTNNLDFDRVSFRLFPNPARELLNIETTTGEMIQFEIYNAHGQLTESNTSFSGRAIVDISDYSSGIYFVRISEDGIKKEIIKFLKE